MTEQPIHRPMDIDDDSGPECGWLQEPGSTRHGCEWPAGHFGSCGPLPEPVPAVHCPWFAADQATIPAGRRINDLLAYARDVAGLTAPDEPLTLTPEDRLLAMALLPEHPDPSGALLAIIGELHTAQMHDRTADHNARDLDEAEEHRQAAAELARDAVLADIRAISAQPVTETVTIPARDQHEGRHSIRVTLAWVCPQCGGPRGKVYPAISYDGSERLHCDGWTNPCGHLDYYAALRREAGVS